MPQTFLGFPAGPSGGMIRAAGVMPGVFDESEGSILKLVCCPFGCFPKIGVPQNGWFMMENPIKVDALGVPLFLETPISFGSFCFFFSFITIPFQD